MGTTLTGKRVQNTYDSLLKITDNDNLTGTPKRITDGLGNDSPIFLSQTKIGIGVSPTYEFQTNSNAKIGGNLIVAGNLTVNGSTTHIDSTIVEIGDNMIELAKDNVANTMDIGWYGTIVSSGEKYVGMKYDAGSGVTTPTFELGLGTVEPSGTAEWTVKGKLVIGAIDSTGGTFSGQITIPQTPTADGHAASKKYVDDHQSVEVAERVEITVKNVSGGQLNKGTIVHVSPSASPPSGNVIEVIKADYDDATKMPAIGILNETIANEGEGAAVMMGAVSGIDTSSFSAGDELYVGNDGAFTNTKPTATTQLVQKIAVVIKVHASNGSIKVFGAGRSNDVPNLVDRDITFSEDVIIAQDDSTDKLKFTRSGHDTYSLSLTDSQGLTINNVTDSRKELQFLGNGNVEFAGNLYIPQYIFHKDDSDTFINFLDDRFVLKIGDVNFLDFRELTGQDIAYFNVDKNDVDFQFRGSTNNNLIRTDASANRVGIGGTPSYTFDVHLGTGNSMRVKSTDQTSQIIIEDDDTTGYVGVEDAKMYMSFNSGGPNGGFYIDSSGNGTFAGGVSMNDLKIFDSNGSSTNRLKASYNGTSGVALFGPDSNGGNTELQIGTSNSGTYTTALTINSSQNATFVGDVKALRFEMNPDFAASNEYLIISKMQNQDGGIVMKSKPSGGSAQNDWQIVNHSSTGDLRFYAYGLAGFALTLDRENGDATFAGDISSKHIVPITDSTYDLGNTTNYWRNIYVDEIKLSTDDEYYLKVYKDTRSINDTSYTTVATVNGNALASGVKINITGTSSSNVVNVDAKILVNHFKDILIKSTSAYYRKIYIKVVSDNNEDFAIELKKDSGGNTNMDAVIEIVPLNDEIVTFTSSHGHTGTSHEHLCEFGESQSSTDADAGNDYHYWLKDDGAKLKFGAGEDLQLYHDGTNSHIKNYTGHLYIENFADDKDIKFLSDNGSGGTEVYFELQGVSGGTNPFTVFPTNSNLVFGNGHDLRIYHDGSNSYVNETGTGSLITQASDYFLRVGGTNNTNNAIVAANGGTLTLYYANSAKLATASYGISVTGYADILGASSDQLRLRTAQSEEYKIGRNSSTGYLDFTGTQANYTGYLFSGTQTYHKIQAFYDGSYTSGFKFSDYNGGIQYNAGDDRLTLFSNFTGTGAKMVFETQGSEKMRIDSSGNVGIGTTSPLGILQLNVDSDHSIMRITAGDNSIAGIDFGKTSDIDDARIRYYNSGRYMQFFVANGERMRIDSSGNVGIGTNSPNYKLDVNGTLRGSSNIYAISTYAVVLDSNSGAGPQITFGSTSDYDQYGRIAQHSSKFQFFTYNRNFEWLNNTTSLMTLQTGGNVGIGTNSPAVKLDVRGEVAIAYNATYGLRFYNDARNNWSSIGNNITGSSSANLVFKDATGEAMRLEGGKLGIGTTSPSAKLDVAGSNAVIWVNPPAGSHAGINFRQGGTFKGWVGLNNSTSCINLSMDGSIANGINVNASHNVGIGTDSPTAKVEIVTAVGADAIRMNYGQSADIFLGFSSANPRILLQDNSNVVTHNFVSNGDNYIVGSNVGIGTTTMQGKLTVVGTTQTIVADLSANTAVGLSVMGVDSNNFNAFTIGSANSTNNCGVVRFKYNGAGSTNNYMGLGFYGNDDILNVKANGRVGIGTTSPENSLHIKSSGNAELVLERNNGAEILLQAQSSVGVIGTQTNNDLDLKTNSTTRIRIKNNGNVGIGTTSPSYPLHVDKSSLGVVTRLANVDGTYNPRIIMYGNSSGSNIQHTWSSSADNLMFHVGGSEGSGVEKMRITPTGIGMFTTSVDSNVKLDVAGAAHFESNGSARVLYLDAGSGNGNIIQFHKQGTNKWEVVGRDGTFYVYKNDGTGSGYRWQINSNGNHTISGDVTVKNQLTHRSNNDTTTLYNERNLAIPYQGSSGTFDFDPVALFGANRSGGYVIIEITGWQTRFNAGYIHWRNDGSGSGRIGTGGVTFRQTAWSGSASGAGISVSTITSSADVIRVTLSGWHSNAHGWQGYIRYPR